MLGKIKGRRRRASLRSHIEYSTDKNFKKDVKKVTIKKNRTVTKTITGLKKKTTYYVSIVGPGTLHFYRYGLSTNVVAKTLL